MNKLNNLIEKPFVKIIRTDKAIYAFDINTGNILRISQKLSEVLDNWQENSELNYYRSSIEFIERLQKDEKIFLGNTVDMVRPNLTKDDLEKKTLKECNHLVLNITESCNLNCTYCIYSGAYPGRRTRSNKVMSWDTAKKAIDLLARGSKSLSDSSILGFYGGEPLLRFNFIRDCVDYANLELGNSPHLFSITTNGTMLNEDIIDYLVTNKFIITISIDGPKYIHDKNRRSIDDEGTFDKIIENIETLRDRCGESYFKDYVNLSSVLSPPYNLQLLNEFFSKFLASIRLSTIEYTSELYKDVSIHEDIGWDPLAKIMKNFCLNQDTEKDFRSAGIGVPYELFSRELRRIHNRVLDQPINHVQSVLGLCQPGKGRAFVSCDGNIYLCERVEGNENMLIGTVEDGIEPNKVIKIINNVSNLDFSRCKSCWVMKFCNLCFAHIVSNNNYSIDKWQFSCDGLKNHFAIALRLYCEIMEENEMALDFLSRK